MDALVLTAREVGGTNLSGRLQKLDTGDELQRLSDTLNEMLDRIESAFRRITQFTADASHELRTPVSLIRTEAELALRRSRSESEYQESLRHILSEAERTTSLIEQLLSLARSDSGRETVHLQPVDLSEVLHGIAKGWLQIAAIRDLDFSASIDARNVFVAGDETLLRRLADILLDNAFKYTPSPGSVTLMLEQQGETAVITIRDSGIGIAGRRTDQNLRTLLPGGQSRGAACKAGLAWGSRSRSGSSLSITVPSQLKVIAETVRLSEWNCGASPRRSEIPSPCSRVRTKNTIFKRESSLVAVFSKRRFIPAYMNPLSEKQTMVAEL